MRKTVKPGVGKNVQGHFDKTRAVRIAMGTKEQYRGDRLDNESCLCAHHLPRKTGR